MKDDPPKMIMDRHISWEFRLLLIHSQKNGFTPSWIQNANFSVFIALKTDVGRNVPGTNLMQNMNDFQ